MLLLFHPLGVQLPLMLDVNATYEKCIYERYIYVKQQQLINQKRKAWGVYDDEIHQHFLPLRYGRVHVWSVCFFYLILKTLKMNIHFITVLSICSCYFTVDIRNLCLFSTWYLKVRVLVYHSSVSWGQRILLHVIKWTWMIIFLTD